MVSSELAISIVGKTGYHNRCYSICLLVSFHFWRMLTVFLIYQSWLLAKFPLSSSTLATSSFIELANSS